LPDIVLDGETGVVVAEDADALAGAWRSLLEDRERRDRMGQAARNRACAEFAPERLAERIEALYAGAGGGAAGVGSPIR
jgi:glycosyltransferase involved in cell wall biosynthesis